MDRELLYREKMKQLFGDADSSLFTADPEFAEILNKFVFGEVYNHGKLTDKERILITLCALTAGGIFKNFKRYIKAGLNTGLSPEDIKEALYQCAPYTGFPKALKAIHKADKVFRKAGISLPVKSMKKTDENNRFNEGLKVQETIFGERIRRMHENAPENQKHIQNYLSAMCFGDFYTRDGLDIKMRELLTLCILSALGGCENQLRSHVGGNLSAGNDKDTMIEAVTQCMPYIGFPRTLNALSCINEIA